MKWSLVTMMIAGSAAAFAGEKRADERQVTLRVRVLEGDPLGSEKHGTIKVLAEPNLTAMVGKVGTFMAGGQVPIGPKENPEFVPFGLQLTFRVDDFRDDKASLDMTLTATPKPDMTQKLVQIQSESTRVIGKVPLSEMTKVRGFKRTPKLQVWVEVAVEVSYPLTQAELTPLAPSKP